MRLTSKAGVAVAAILLAAPAAAQTTGEALAKSRNCMACHQVDVKRVGPPLASIAKRYAGPPEAVDYLAQSIRKGGGGRWGAVPMPAQTQVTPDEAKQLAEWILSLKSAQ
jgi:cytochrome c